MQPARLGAINRRLYLLDSWTFFKATVLEFPPSPWPSMDLSATHQEV